MVTNDIANIRDLCGSPYQDVTSYVPDLCDEIDALRAENARLTERERIVDEWGSAELRGLRTRAEAAEARLAAVEALHNETDLHGSSVCSEDGFFWPCDTISAARGEGDR